jgi:hypothetical protein
MHDGKGGDWILKTVKDFVFGTFYLVSGIYSLGFSLLLVYTTQPVSGNPAVITVRDGIFPFEVALFAVFGAIFFAAAVYHLLRSVRSYKAEGLAVNA